jgi:hypothetical protein
MSESNRFSPEGSARIALEQPVTDLTATLKALGVQLATALAPGRLREFGDDGLLGVTAELERLGRRVDALRVEAAGEIGDRSRPDLGSAALSNRKGCRSPLELLERATLVSAATAARRLKLGKHTRPIFSLVGEQLPATFPAVSSALNTGTLGVDSALAIVKGLSPILGKGGVGEVEAAETELTAAATGLHPAAATEHAEDATDADGPSAEAGPPPVPADEVAIQTSVWKAVLDPDGLRPDENRAMRNRAFSRGFLKDGLVCGSYALMPEIAAKLTRLFDAFLAPKTTGAFLSDEQRAAAEASGDTRTADQQRHDVFAAMVDGFARSDSSPVVGGAAPTVLVSVRGKDLNSGRGVGWIDGQQLPVSMETIKQFVCTGGIQPVRFDTFGRIIELGSPQRTFTPAQRRAINLRDGTCLCCTIPAAWTEIHHVIPDREGGPTETDNGVSLCWYHHRTIDSSGWDIRMQNGVPHIRAPLWLDATATWRPVTKSRTLLSDRLDGLD